jgi:hypothetical protein
MMSAKTDCTPEFRKFCESRKIIPEKLIQQFMADASRSLGNGGSNERDAAASYVSAVEHLVTVDANEYYARLRAQADLS